MFRAVAGKLKDGAPLDDTEFDALFPPWARWLSTIHWTPVQVARRAAELLITRPGLRVLDVGSGVGKFSLVGALTTPGVFHGVEQRLHFIQTARTLAEKLGAVRARFHHSNMTELDWRRYDAFYLYNPFAENLTTEMDPIDRTIDLEPLLFDRYVTHVQRQLRRMRVGTRVATYHGFGGDMPRGWRLERDEPCWAGSIEVWAKAEA